MASQNTKIEATKIEMPQTGAPEAPTLKNKKLKERAEKVDAAKEKEAALKSSIQTPAQRKIEVLAGIKPDEMTDFDKLAAAVKGIIAFLSGDKEGMEEVKNLFLKAGANKDELWGVMNDGRQDESDPTPPPEEEETFSTPDGKEMSRAKRDAWNPEQFGLERKKAFGQRYVAEKALRETEKQKLSPYLEEAERKYNVPRTTILAIVAKESSMNPLAEHKYAVKDKNGKPILDAKTGKPRTRTNARGFAQAISSTMNEYRRETGQANADPFDPRTGILLTAWYIRKNINTIQAAVKKGSVTFSHKVFADVVKERAYAKEHNTKMRKLPEKKYTIPVTSEALFDADNVEAVYLCHNSGPSGYLAQCYLKEALKRGDPEEIKYATAALFEFQQEVLKGRSDWQNRGDYARQVAAVAWNINELTKT